MTENASKKEAFSEMTQGRLFQKLRKERNISQETLVKGISSRSTLSSFENRNTHLSSEMLFIYLDRLNITPNEFQLLLHDRHPSKKQNISKEYEERHYTRTLTPDFLQSLFIEYEQTHDVFYLLLYLQGSLENARQVDDFDSALFKKHAKIVQNYLFRIETWGKFEISFFINLIFIFDEEMLQLHINPILNKIMSHSDDYLYSNVISVALLNGCHYAVIKKILPSYNSYYKQLLHYLILPTIFT